MNITVISLFPQMFDVLSHGVTGRALANELLDVAVLNPRDYSHNSYQQVDDRPYGGGPGMVMMAPPLCDAVNAAKNRTSLKPLTVYLSPQGSPINQQKLVDFSKSKQHLIMIAGRYEGIDERVINSVCDEEWSLGDIVLSGGEFAAMVVIDTLARLMPGALGNEESAEQDSFMSGLLDHPHYTRPAVFEGQTVPEVLLGGNHELIRQWRLKQALAATWLKRPDLLAQKTLNAEQQRLLDEVKTEYGQLIDADLD